MKQLCTHDVVIDILSAKVGVPRDTPQIETATWEELGVESLGLIETLSSLEQTLDVQIPHEKVLQTRSVQELVTLVNAAIIRER